MSKPLVPLREARQLEPRGIHATTIGWRVMTDRRCVQVPFRREGGRLKCDVVALQAA